MDDDKERIIVRSAANVLEALILKGWRTDLDGQIECMEILSENMIKCPTLLAIVDSLKELRAIKKKQIPKS